MAFAVFLFFTQGFQAQISVKGGATLYIEKDAVLQVSEDISSSEQIFLASGATIYHSDSGENYQIAQQKVSKPEVKEESALKIAEIQKEKKPTASLASLELPVSQKKEFFTTQKSDESFNSDDGFSFNIIQTPTYQLKDFIAAKHLQFIISSWKNTPDFQFHTIENHENKIQLSFFTRPPPVLV